MTRQDELREELVSAMRVLMSVERGVDNRVAAWQYIYDRDTAQRAEIARLREALVEIVEKCEDEEWEYMFGDIIIRAQQAIKEVTP